MTTTPIPVTVDTFDTRRQHKGAKSGHSYDERVKNDDSYEDGDLKGLHPCDCLHFRSIGGKGWIPAGGGGGEPRTENTYGLWALIAYWHSSWTPWEI